jgi:acyl-homoserine lactone acylase PvdQ
MHKTALRLSALLFVGVALSAPAQKPASSDVARWQRQAQNITIIRDDWGIPHIYGKTDADAVFGMIYAQAEDDFNRVENNYLLSMGRLAEAEGEKEIWRDLRMKMFIAPDSMKAMYARSPGWLKQLMDGWADGLNFYLYTHPQTKPRVITRFEPWMALTFSEGSIGGDIERVNLQQLAAFYGDRTEPTPPSASAQNEIPREPGGSNGVAISPSNTVNHRALLLINPHTSFFFRAELQMQSDEGLDAYGAVTWGQFFIYQGFNPRIGWMHTSSGVDNIDEYLETITKKGDAYYYRHGDAEKPLAVRKVSVPYRTPTGMKSREFTIYRSQHGPIVRAANGKWVAVSLMESPLDALIQSYSRTRARDYASFAKTMELHTNSSNNTIYADADGHIAYFHSNFIPKRDTSFDWTRPVDGSNPATDWQGVLSLAQSPNLLDPANGWLYNSNNWPWSAAGPYSPDMKDFPKYVETGREESARGFHALRVLSNKKDFTIQSLIDAAYDSYLPAFAKLIPPLITAYDSTPAGDPLKARLADQIAVLRNWDYRWGVNSVPTSLAVFWGEDVLRRAGPDARRAGEQADDYVANGAPRSMLLQSLAAAADKLAADFGKWDTPWGEINRFQRLTGDIVQPFNDAGPSIPVGFTSSRWGSLASFGARPYPNTKKWYGTSGNSFVAVVEFGKDSVRARAVSAGGESGDPKSPHFNDQAQRYATGNLRQVYFYKPQLTGHTERTYHPGQ